MSWVLRPQSVNTSSVRGNCTELNCISLIGFGGTTGKLYKNVFLGPGSRIRLILFNCFVNESLRPQWKLFINVDFNPLSGFRHSSVIIKLLTCDMVQQRLLTMGRIFAWTFWVNYLISYRSVINWKNYIFLLTLTNILIMATIFGYSSIWRHNNKYFFISYLSISNSNVRLYVGVSQAFRRQGFKKCSQTLPHCWGW